MNTKNFFVELLPLAKESPPTGRQGDPNYFGGRRVCFSKTLPTSILLFFFLLPYETRAQCAMCRAVLESEENVAIAEGVNNGIVYLMAIPYILVAVLFYFVYREMKSS